MNALYGWYLIGFPNLHADTGAALAVTLELRWDGAILKSIVNPGKNAVGLQKASFDPETGAVHLDVQTSSQMGKTVRYVIEGTVEGGTLIGSWSHDKKKGDFKLVKK